MLGAKTAFCLIYIALGACEAGFLESLNKCSIRDSECEKNVLETTAKKYAAEGIPEYGVPPFNTYKAKNDSISVLGLVEMSVTNGIVEGMSDCTFMDFKVDVGNGLVTAESLCDQITLKGHYNVKPADFLKTLTGSSLEGDGNGQIQINKMILKMKVPFKVEKHEDSEIYLRPIAKESEYSTDVTDSITFEADNVIMGGEEVSKRMIKFMNDNWRLMLKVFGRSFSDKVMEEFFLRVEDIFGNKLPAKYYIVERNLAKYIKQ